MWTQAPTVKYCTTHGCVTVGLKSHSKCSLSKNFMHSVLRMTFSLTNLQSKTTMLVRSPCVPLRSFPFRPHFLPSRAVFASVSYGFYSHAGPHKWFPRYKTMTINGDVNHGHRNTKITTVMKKAVEGVASCVFVIYHEAYKCMCVITHSTTITTSTYKDSSTTVM